MYILLLLFWFMLHGKITLEIFGLGLLVCGSLFWFMCRYLGYSWKKEGMRLQKLPQILRYTATLFLEIIKTNLQVIKIILSPNMEVNPILCLFSTDLQSDEAKVALSHSITLTPGTYTVFLEDDSYLIHALDPSFVDGVEESLFVEQLRNLEGEHHG